MRRLVDRVPAGVTVRLNIWIETYVNARNFRPVEPTLAIRVFDPGAARDPMDRDGSWRNCPQAPFPDELYTKVWGYTFADVNYDMYEEPDRSRIMRGRFATPFTANMADDLIRKFDREKDKAGAALIHCHAGVSRSVAIAHALAECFELDAHWSGRAAKFLGLAKTEGYYGNDFVYRLVCEAAERIL